MPQIFHQIMVKAPAARAFEALTTQLHFKGWWTDDVAVEPTVGSVARFGFGGGAVIFEMRIEELSAPQQIRWTCLKGPDEWIGTDLTWTFTPAAAGATDGATIIRLRHDGFRSMSRDFPRTNTTWGHLMHYLKKYLETNAVDPFFRRDRPMDF